VRPCCDGLPKSSIVQSVERNSTVHCGVETPLGKIEPELGAIEEAGAHEDRRWDSFFTKDRPGVAIVSKVPIIERHNNCVFKKFARPGQHGHGL